MTIISKTYWQDMKNLVE